MIEDTENQKKAAPESGGDGTAVLFDQLRDSLRRAPASSPERPPPVQPIYDSENRSGLSIVGWPPDKLRQLAWCLSLELYRHRFTGDSAEFRLTHFVIASSYGAGRPWVRFNNISELDDYVRAGRGHLWEAIKNVGRMNVIHRLPDRQKTKAIRLWVSPQGWSLEERFSQSEWQRKMQELVINQNIEQLLLPEFPEPERSLVEAYSEVMFSLEATEHQVPHGDRQSPMGTGPEVPHRDPRSPTGTSSAASHIYGTGYNRVRYRSTVESGLNSQSKYANEQLEDFFKKRMTPAELETEMARCGSMWGILVSREPDAVLEAIGTVKMREGSSPTRDAAPRLTKVLHDEIIGNVRWSNLFPGPRSN